MTATLPTKLCALSMLSVELMLSRVVLAQTATSTAPETLPPPSQADAAAPGNAAAQPTGESGSTAEAKTVAAVAEEAKQAADEATELAEEAKEASEEAKEAAEGIASVDGLRAGKFMQYGISAGFAYMLATPSLAEGSDGAHQDNSASTTMPYVVVAPLYWTLGDISAVYCGTRYADSAASARETAWKYAVRKARVAKPDATDDELETYIREELHWDRKADGDCWRTYLGVYLGKPLDYDANVVPQTDADPAKREVKTDYSIGFAFLPNAYVTLLAGLNFSSINEPALEATDDRPAQPERLRRFTTFTVGLGGNIDLVGGLFK